MISNHIGLITDSSLLYQTEPWGNEEQDTFVNQAIKVNTACTPTEVLDQIFIIEQKMGRKRSEKWGPRIIDIDIIFYGHKIIKNHNLIIPHPQISNRSFVLKPLMDICPQFVHPELNKSVAELYEICPDKKKVSKLNL